MKAKIFGLATVALGLMSPGYADFIWDNDSLDGEWKTPANWSGTGGDPDNSIPTASGTVVIDNGNTVHWDGATGQSLPASLNLTLSGNSTLTAEGVIRLNGASITVNPGASLASTAGGFWDLNNADMTFEDGAMVTIDDWENKGMNTFTFKLSATGFTSLAPNVFRTNLMNSDITDAFYEADLQSYAGPYGVITLVDYNIDAYPNGGMDNTLFQTAGGLSLLNDSAYPHSFIRWNDTEESIELVLIPEPSSLSLLGLFGLVIGSVLRKRF